MYRNNIKPNRYWIKKPEIPISHINFKIINEVTYIAERIFSSLGIILLVMILYKVIKKDKNIKRYVVVYVGTLLLKELFNIIFTFVEGLPETVHKEAFPYTIVCIFLIITRVIIIIKIFKEIKSDKISKGEE